MPTSRFNARSALYHFYEETLRKRQTFHYYAFLQQLQWQPEEVIRDFQWQELKKLLDHSYVHVPFHRRRMQSLNIHPSDIQRPEDYASLPPLEKRDLLDHQEELIADNAIRDHLYRKQSSGSTGTVARYQYDRNSYEWRQAAHLRGNEWAGAPLGRREFHLWGQPLKPLARGQALKARLHQWVKNQYFANVYDPSPDQYRRHLEAFNQFRPQVLIAYAHSVYHFARFIQRHGSPVHSPKAIISSAEKLHLGQRRVVEEVFGAPVFERYGCQEVMLIGMECEQRQGFHVTADNLYVEMVKDGVPARAGETGEVYVTDLHNYAMPFLRYRVGDLAVPSDRSCACGRGLPMIEAVEGRTQEALVTPDGRRLTAMLIEKILRTPLWVEEYQVKQLKLDQVEVWIKPNRACRSEWVREVQNALQEWLGDGVILSIQIVDAIPRTPGGKHRPILSLSELVGSN